MTLSAARSIASQRRLFSTPSPTDRLNIASRFGRSGRRTASKEMPTALREESAPIGGRADETDEKSICRHAGQRIARPPARSWLPGLPRPRRALSRRHDRPAARSVQIYLADARLRGSSTPASMTIRRCSIQGRLRDEYDPGTMSDLQLRLCSEVPGKSQNIGVATPATASRQLKPDRRVNGEEMRVEPSGHVGSSGIGGAKRCSAIEDTILCLSRCSPKPCNQDRPPLFRKTAPAERATARRVKLTPRLELATACMRRRRAPEARPPPPPSERRRRRRVCPGEPPATVAVTLDEAALGQSAEPHGDGALVAAGCLRPLHDASLRIRRA